MIPEILSWWLAAEMLGLAAFPIVEKLACGSLRDKGYSVSKIFGMIFITYVVWILASLKILKYGPVSIALAILALLAVSAFFFEKSRHIPMLKRVIKIDAIFTLAFLFFVLVRAYNPDIAGAEKPMDFAILNSIGRSDYFPPQDPWFSGRTLPYYYMGHLSASVLDKLTLTNNTAVSYNLAIALMFALAATAAFGIGYNLTGNNSGGLLAVFLVLLAGNIASVVQFVDYLSSGQNFLSWDYWRASRVIPDTINEFPYFTFLHADLHAHLFSIPVQLLLISVALGIWLSGTLSIPIAALSLGYLIPLHSWDYPLYLVMILAVAAIMASKTKRALIAAIGSVLLYGPFILSYGSRSLGLALSAKHSPLPQFVMVYGAFMAAIYLFLFTEERNNTIRASGIALIVLAVFLQNSLLAMVPMALLSASRLLSSKKRGPTQFALLLALAGSMIAIFIEIFYVVDGMPPPWERMNTVFRLGEVIWILLALSSAFFLSELFKTHGRWKPLGIAALLLLLSAFFVFATGSRSGWFSRAPGLDGTSWMAEKASIDWLNKNVRGQPVILEASGRDYESSSRVSSATGLPTVIGWPGHEVHWRWGAGAEINERISDTDRIYSTADQSEARALLGRYGAKYVFVGNEERKKYPEAGLNKFVASFRLEYSDNLAQIYGVE